MKTLFLILAGSGLILTILPPLLFFVHMTDLGVSQQLMTLGMLLWFTGDLPRVIDRRTRS